MGYHREFAYAAKSSPGCVSFKADSSKVDTLRAAVNFGERRGSGPPDILLLHYTGMEDGNSALDWLCCEESGVSCHYLIQEDGEIVQMVQESKRAHHAGAGSWEGDPDTNSRSIGIEIVNCGHPGDLPDYPAKQMEAVAVLCRDIIERHGIEARRVLAHSDIAPGRKMDPGENFDWQWLAGRGVGHWITPAPLGSGRYIQRGDEGKSVEALQAMLSLYGYGVELSGKFDDCTHNVVEAFQRHFRPEKVDGIADVSTVDTLHRLLKALDYG